MHSKFEDELNRAVRKGHSVSTLLVDIDHFKQINDNHGHDAGDLVLVEVSNRMESSIRQYDVLSRHGGEEFLMLFPDCDREEGMVIAEKLRQVIRGTPVCLPDGTELNVTASMGLIVGQPVAEDNQSSFISQADEALYEAKEGGRDRVVPRTFARA